MSRIHIATQIGDIVQTQQNKYQIIQDITHGKRKNKKIQPQKSHHSISNSLYIPLKTYIVKNIKENIFYILKKYQVHIISSFHKNDKNLQKFSKIIQKRKYQILKQLKNTILHHPNLIQIQQLSWDNLQQQYSKYIQERMKKNLNIYCVLNVVEQYCQEGDLDYFVRRELKKCAKKDKMFYFSQKLLSKWFLQILLALEHLHLNNICHQKLSAWNLFFTPLGNIKLDENYIFWSLNHSKQFQKKQNKSPTVSQKYQPVFNEKKFIIGEKKDIIDFGFIMVYLCNNWAYRKNKKSLKMEDKQHIVPFYSQELDQIFIKCLNIKKSTMSVKQILRYPYFLQVMRQFILDKKLNVSAFQRIPIKKYMVHKKIKPESGSKKKNQNIISPKTNETKQNTSKLPKITKKDPQKVLSSLKDIQKVVNRQNLFKKDLNKNKTNKVSQIYETKDNQSNNGHKQMLEKIIGKRQSRQKVKRQQQEEKFGKNLQTKSKKPNQTKIMAPPSLSKIKKAKLPVLSRLQQQKQVLQQKNPTTVTKNMRRSQQKRKKQISIEKNGSKDKKFPLTPQITFGKKGVPVQQNQVLQSTDDIQPVQREPIRQNTKIQERTINCSRQSQLQNISQNLAKIFSDLQIRQDDQQQFSFEMSQQQQQELRLTFKDENGLANGNGKFLDLLQLDGQAQLVKTYKTKLDQLISQLEEKYQPNLEPIIEKTKEWDSNDFFVNQQLMKRLRLQDGESLLPLTQD